MYKIGQPISKTDFYRLAPLGLEACYKHVSYREKIKIYSTKTKGLILQVRGNIQSFEDCRQAIEDDLNKGNFLISKLPNYPLLKRKPNV